MTKSSRAPRALHRSLTTLVAVIALLASTLSGIAFADGTETLGPPSVPLADGSGFAIGGTGLADGQPASFDVDVPPGASVEQVLLYWEGFDRRETDGGDDTITVNGIPVTGVVIGGTTRFFRAAYSTAFRADITSLGLVTDGTSTLTIEDVAFTRINNGAGALVVYDDGSEVDLQLVDGNDLAMIGFTPPLDTTVPQTFDFAPVPFDRTVDLSMFATSVDGTPEEPRPNAVLVTIDGSTTVFDSPFTSNVGNEWDAVTLTVTVPAGATSMTIQAVSEDVDPERGLPASFGWIGVAAAIPLPAELGDYVWFDADGDGLQGPAEDGVADVNVTLADCDGNVVDTTMTGPDGEYLFSQLEPGCYQVSFEAPDGLVFTTPDAGDDTIDSDADPDTGASPQVELVSGESNLTIDAGLVEPAEPRIDVEKLTNGNQADGANDPDVPQIAPGDDVTWTYVVTNTGDVPFAAADVEVTDDILGPITTIVDQGDGDDVLSPGEVWTYEATGTADDLTAPSAGTVVVDGCNPDGTTVPGDRATYENIGTVTVPGDADSDLSHYCNPPDPRIDVEKLTNGNQADGANDPDVPQIAPGDDVTWTYVVTNTGDVPFAAADVEVTDDILGPITTIVDQGDGDDVLSPGEVWTYEATGTADDLTAPSAGTVVVDGCNPDGTTVPGDRATYENIGTVTVPGDADSDLSHYCNPPDPRIDVEKLTNGNQADGANDPDVPQIAPGDDVTWTYVVTNTGDVPFAAADVEVTDDILGPITTIVDQGDGDDVLSPGEVWTYEATGTADDLTAPSAGTVVVDGCNPDGTTVPGDRATYENIGTVTVPGDADSDLSHYCNPPDPRIDVEKLTNGNQADGANDPDVPQIAPGDDVTWTYVVTNTGDVPFAAADVEVTDDILGPITTIVDQGDGDDVLSPGEVWTYEATGTADDLTAPSAGTVVVDGCNPDGTTVPGDRATYENIGTVTVPGDADSDLSHYCNPPEPDIQLQKTVYAGHDGGTSCPGVELVRGLNGDPVTYCFEITNTGNTSLDVTEVTDTDLGVTIPVGALLAPGDVVTVFHEDTIDGDLVNTAEVCGNPTDDLGNDIADLADVCDDDPAEVEEIPLGSIGDFVWVDEDGDGIQDPGEPGVDGATVTLMDCDGNELDSQTTGPDGAYLFTGLEAGCYTVHFELPDGFVFTIADQNGDDVDSDADQVTGMSPQVLLSEGEDDLSVDAGAVPLGSIGDFVWLDENGNGLQDPGEPGVDGATVTLSDCDGNELDSQTTGPDGAYLFTGLEADCYKVTFELPDGLGFTTPDVGDDDTIDSDADPTTGMSPEIDLGIGEDDDTIDAGAVDLLGSIGDFVWDDLNGNGLQDPDEPGIEGAVVTLSDCDGNELDSQTTGPDGAYLFTDLEAGCYEVGFDLPPSYGFTTPDVGDDDTIDSDADPTTGTSPQTDLAAGEDNLTIDAGAVSLGSIGDFVWLDENGNGLQDPGEPGVDGATVTLSDCDGNELDSQTTGPDGAYLFTGLEADCYKVTFELPDGLGFTTPDVGDDDTIDSDADPTTGMSPEIDLGIGEDDDTIDAGAVDLLGSIGDFVWDDLNGNGLQDPDEPGIEGAVVTLSDCDGNELDSQTTGPDGAYLFTDLEAGCYEVGFDLPPSYGFTTPDVGDDDTIDSDADPTTGTSPQTDLAAGEDNLTIDAGGVLLQPEIMLEKYTLVVPSQTGGDVCEAFDKPAQLTMLYTGDGPDATSSSQDSGKVVVTGDPADASPVYIVASKDPLGGGDVYFAGTVDLGGEFVIDATFAGQDSLASATHVTVYSSQGGAVLQEIEFHTSCSQPLFLGDQFGSIQLVEFVDKNGDGDVLPPPSTELGEDADTPTGPTAKVGDTVQWTYVVTNPGDLPLADVVVTDDAGTPDDPSDDFAAGGLLEGGLNVGDADLDGLLDPGEEWLFRATGTARLGQYANLGTVVAQPVLDDAPFGEPVSDTDPSHHIGIFGADVCEAFDKPAQLTMLYTGDGPDATSSSQDSGKVVVTGDPADASPVYIVASKDPLGGGDVYFAGTVDLGGEFVIDATFAGQDSLASATHVTVYSSQGGAVLQEIEFHTSCSQPLFLGDQFGSIQLVDFVDKNGDGPGTTPLTGIVLDSFEFKGKELKIKLENLGDADVVLDSLDVSWPTGTNGGLTEVKNGGDSIFEPASPVLTSPTSIDDGDWTANADKRTLKGGDTREFKLKFENDALADLAVYDVTFTFSDGTTVNVPG